MREQFRRFAHNVSTVSGSPWAFILAVAVIAVWAITGPIFGFSDTWQLVINTGTTVVTFLMVFLIQNTQNRDSLALHLKLDELIRAVRTARNQLVDLEDLSDKELRQLQGEFERLRRHSASDRVDPLDDVAVAAERVKVERRQNRGRERRPVPDAERVRRGVVEAAEAAEVAEETEGPGDAGEAGAPSDRPRRRRRRRGGRGRSSPS